MPSMKPRNRRAAVLVLALAVTSLAMSAVPAAAKVLATVNGKQITDEDVRIAADDLRGSIPPQIQGPARDAYILDFLIDGELVAQKAIAQKADQTPDFAKKLAFAREKLLMEGVLADVAKTAATDAAVKAAYDKAAKDQKPQTEIHARHILVNTEDEAKAALKRLMDGKEDFATIAKAVSKDSGAEGGDLGWFTKDRMVPEFADAAFKLEVGQVSDPVKTPFGWHIIEVLDKREKPFPPFDEVKDQ
ncbi:MAG: peptidylprolyl isomerase, partial [Methylocapsa sp.]|nr:peptidylprolyl isomerase [Methylocapsa sp.]